MSNTHTPITPNLAQFLGTTTTPSWLWGLAYAQQKWEDDHYRPQRSAARGMKAPYVELSPRDLFNEPVIDPTPLLGSHSILHVTNNRGGWGKGFTGALTNAVGREPEDDYRRTKKAQQLGQVLDTLLSTTPFHGVYQCCAQDGYQSATNPVPFRLGKFVDCLTTVRGLVDAELFEVIHMPRVGAGLGGGNWSAIRRVIIRELCDHGIPVIVYGLE